MSFTEFREIHGQDGIAVRDATLAGALRQDNPYVTDERIVQASRLLSQIGGAILARPVSVAAATALAGLLQTHLRAILDLLEGEQSADLKAMLAKQPELVEKIERTEGDLIDLQSVLTESDSVEVRTGTGLGTALSPEAGMARLDRLSHAVPVESWAGEVAKPGDLAARLGVSRATLDSWRHDGIVIGLPRGRRAHVYPVEQFYQGRPRGGLAAVIRAAHGNHAVAWRWLRTPHIDFDGNTPLAALEGGEADAVAAAAARSLA